MRNLIILLALLIPIIGLAQEPFAFADDKDFDVSAVPDSLKDQSFVVLAIRDQYEVSARRLKTKAIYSGSPETHNAVEKLRMRAALLDEAAVEKFGFVSFEKGELKQVMIIKPDGKVEEVDIDDAIVVEKEEVQSKGINNAKRSGRTRSKQEEKYYKLALTNLTPGDIVDITFRYEEDFIGLFEMTMDVLPTSHPILSHKIHFKFDKELRRPKDDWKKVKFRFSSHNGAPEIKEVDDYHFVFEDVPRMAYESELWSMAIADLPTIKYAFYTYGALKYFDQEYSKGFLLPALKEDKLLEVAEDAARLNWSAKDYDIELFLKRSKPKVKKLMKTEPMKYYSTLHRLQRQYLLLPKTYGMGSRIIQDMMKYWFLNYKMPGSVVVVLPRYMKSYDDLTFFREIDQGVRIPDEENVYIFDMNTFRSLGDIPAKFEGCIVLETPKFNPLEVRAMDRKYDRETPDSGGDWYRLPVSEAKDNRQHHEMTIGIDLKEEEVTIETEITATGHQRARLHPYMVQLDRFIEDEKFLKEYELRMNWPIKADQDDRDEIEESKVERLKDYVEDSWGEVEVVDIKTVQTGRTTDNPEAIISQKVKTSDMLKKVGPNYLLSAGMLIHAQVHVEEEKRNRRTNIYMDYARTYDETISIEIPAGYTAEGLENFAFNVDNETGSFSASAVLAGNRIIISAKKVYKKNYQPKEKWPLMLEFIDAAYQFTQGNILFRKQ
ncbi:MAG: hypothetical protein AB8F95_05495 [Bacteroidia bacterium]